MKNIFCLLTFLLIYISRSFSQDFHLAQFDTNPLYLNPALTGERVTDAKGVFVGVNYRDQSGGYTNKPGSFKTAAICLDVPLTDRLSIGQLVSNNKTVDGSFNTLNFLVSGSYKIIGSHHQNDRQNLSFGLQAGFLNTSVNTTSFLYASQYSPNSTTGFDNNLASGEKFQQLSFYKLDCNFGIYYRFKSLSERLTLMSGLSFYHIEKQSVSNTIESTLTTLRSNFHASAIYKLTDKFSLMPQFLYMNQARASEYNMGLLLHYKMNQHYEPIIGLSFIDKKDLVLQAGLKFEKNTIRFSYSSAVGYLKNFINNGLEFSIIHTSNKHVHDTPVVKQF